MTTLASHQCVSGLTSGLGVICGSSLLLVLVLAPRVFLVDTVLFFSPSSKTNITKFLFDLESEAHSSDNRKTAKSHLPLNKADLFFPLLCHRDLRFKQGLDSSIIPLLVKFLSIFYCINQLSKRSGSD